ncbi:unnamed protein product, partial [Polarella glacialis]
VEEVRIACATSPKGFELKAVVKEAGVKVLPPSAPKTVVTGASAELRHALDGLEARSAVEDHLEDARVMHAEQQMATAQSRRNELERALQQQRREAGALAQKQLRGIEAEARRTLAAAEQRARTEEMSLAAAEETLSRAEWRLGQLQRKAASFANHSARVSDNACDRAAQASSFGQHLAERVRLEGLGRARAAQDFADVEGRRLACLAAMPGLRPRA